VLSSMPVNCGRVQGGQIRRFDADFMCSYFVRFRRTANTVLKSTVRQIRRVVLGEPPVRISQPLKRFWSLGTIQTCNVVRQIAIFSQAFSSLPVGQNDPVGLVDEFGVAAILGLQKSSILPTKTTINSSIGLVVTSRSKSSV
jgi:hypothetical protein